MGGIELFVHLPFTYLIQELYGFLMDAVVRTRPMQRDHAGSINFQIKKNIKFGQTNGKF